MVTHYTLPFWLHTKTNFLEIGLTKKIDLFSPLQCLIDNKKMPLIVHELITAELWRAQVLPRILDIGKPASSFQIYMVLFHEANLVNLLETVLFRYVHLLICFGKQSYFCLEKSTKKFSDMHSNIFRSQSIPFMYSVLRRARSWMTLRLTWLTMPCGASHIWLWTCNTNPAHVTTTIQRVETQTPSQLRTSLGKHLSSLPKLFH